MRRRGTIGSATAQTHCAFSPSAIPSPSQERYRSRVLLDQLAHLVVSLSAIRHPIAAGSWTSWRVRVVLSNDTARGRVLRSNCRRGRDGSSQRATNSRARPVRNRSRPSRTKAWERCSKPPRAGRMEADSISQEVFDKALFESTRPDVPDGMDILWRERNGLQIVIITNPSCGTGEPGPASPGSSEASGAHIGTPCTGAAAASSRPRSELIIAEA